MPRQIPWPKANVPAMYDGPQRSEQKGDLGLVAVSSASSAVVFKPVLCPKVQQPEGAWMATKCDQIFDIALFEPGGSQGA